MDELILPRIARGEERAVQQCLERYGSLVWSLARRQMGGSEEAEDAVQEIFVEIWKHAARFDPERASESTFVAMIARRRLIDRMRSRQRRPDHVPLDKASSNLGDDSAERTQMRAEADQARRAMGDLRPAQREVLELVLHEGLSHSQVSDTLDMPIGTVKTHARRGLKALRAKLLDEPGAEGRARS